MKLQRKSSVLFFSAMLAFIGWASACQNTTVNSQTSDTKKDSVDIHPADTIKVVGQFNEMAKYIAGMAIDEKSPVAQYTNISQYKTYCLQSDSVWKKFGEVTLEKVDDWAKSEIADVNNVHKTIFYPFSGPDYLYVGHFFPKADKIIMFGLEPVGIPPVPSEMFKDSLKVFSDIDTAMHDALNLKYFRTIDMARDLRNKNVKGTLPVIMLFVARTGNVLINVRPVELNADGNIAYLNEFVEYFGNNQYNKGAELTIFDSKTNSRKTIYYFSADISDDGLKTNKNCKQFFTKLDTTMVTYIKSASFLMHRETFTFIRNTVFAKSKVILQDDSGIRFRFFDQKKWNIQLYGVYTKPFGLFARFMEYDLAKAYIDKKAKPLNFSIGYLTESNMLLAKKIK